MHTHSTHVLRFFGFALATLGIVLVFLVGSAHAQVLGGGTTGMEWYTLGSPYMYTTSSDVFGAGVYSRMGSFSPWLPGGYYPNWPYWMQIYSQAGMYGGYGSGYTGGIGYGTGSGGYGSHCGGFIQNASSCGAGYHCQLNSQTPDTGGMCVPNTGS